MTITKLHTSPYETNTYVFEGNTSCFCIDPGGDADRILAASKKFNKPIEHILLTHAHWDHVGAVMDIKRAIGAKVYIHKSEIDAMCEGAPIFGVVEPDVVFEGDAMIEIDGINIEVLHTPGHSAGSVCYIIANYMFSGDTLFKLEIGRCDLPTGDFAVIKKSLKRLFSLKKDYRVFPGHGDSSGLFFEKKNNPYA